MNNEGNVSLFLQDAAVLGGNPPNRYPFDHIDSVSERLFTRHHFPMKCENILYGAVTLIGAFIVVQAGVALFGQLQKQVPQDRITAEEIARKQRLCIFVIGYKTAGAMRIGRRYELKLPAVKAKGVIKSID